MKAAELAAIRPRLVAAVKAHAGEHYDEGWQVVVDSMTDEEIGRGIGEAETDAGAIRKIRLLVQAGVGVPDAGLPAAPAEPPKPCKVLSVRPEWAWLIMHLGKDVENRTWRTKHRGELLIHASKRPAPEAREYAAKLGIEIPADVPRGVILGSVQLVDVVESSESPWAMDDNLHWLVSDPKPWQEPVPANGTLGLWDWQPDNARVAA